MKQNDRAECHDNQDLVAPLPLFPEWQAQHADELKNHRALPPQITTMWRRYGKNESATCGNCVHLCQKYFHNKNYYKCDLYGDSNGSGTDFRRKWSACGKFERDTDAAQSGQS